MEPEPTTLESLVFQALGEASMAWSEIPRGIFDSEKAKAISEDLIDQISRLNSPPTQHCSDDELAKQFAQVINRNSLENGSDTPDFILGEYLVRCLHAYDLTVNTREKWYGRKRATNEHLA